MSALLDRLGAPHRRYGVVHVAGSKGKGSTSAIAALALASAGHRTGLATSPHLHSWRERIVVDGEPVSEGVFADLAERTEAAAVATEVASRELGGVTTFELVTAMGFLAFAESGCDIAVVEVGLGGEWDATNVVDPVVSAISRIDLEHTAILGPTAESIAAAKAGIVKPGRPVVVGAQPPGVLAVFEHRANDTRSPLHAAGRDWATVGGWRRFDLTGPWGAWCDLTSALPGDHQLENVGLAAGALWCAGTAGFETGEAAFRWAVAGVRSPGRFERIVPAAGPPVVLDGAHTPAAAAAFAAALRDAFPDRLATAVVGLSADKDAVAVVAALAPAVRGVVATRADSPRAADPAALGEAARGTGLPAIVVPTVSEALARARDVAGPVGLIAVTGSLFVVAEAREALGLAVPDPAWGPSLAEGTGGGMR